jgi:phosphoribosylaminoimidazole (AIR) synthetase
MDIPLGSDRCIASDWVESNVWTPAELESGMAAVHHFQTSIGSIHSIDRRKDCQMLDVFNMGVGMDIPLGSDRCIASDWVESNVWTPAELESGMQIGQIRAKNQDISYFH